MRNGGLIMACSNGGNCATCTNPNCETKTQFKKCQECRGCFIGNIPIDNRGLAIPEGNITFDPAPVNTTAPTNITTEITAKTTVETIYAVYKNDDYFVDYFKGLDDTELMACAEATAEAYVKANGNEALFQTIREEKLQPIFLANLERLKCRDKFVNECVAEIFKKYGTKKADPNQPTVQPTNETATTPTPEPEPTPEPTPVYYLGQTDSNFELKAITNRKRFRR